MGVSCVFFCFSPQKHEKHAQAGVFLIIGTPFPRTSTTRLFGAFLVFGALPPHPQHPKTSATARFREVDLSLPTTTTHNPRKRARRLVFEGYALLLLLLLLSLLSLSSLSLPSSSLSPLLFHFPLN